MGVFKERLKKAYELYPAFKIARAEEHRQTIIKEIKRELDDAVTSGRKFYEGEMSQVYLTYWEEFCREEDLSIKSEKQPDTVYNEHMYKFRVWGWADHEETMRASLGHESGYSRPFPPPRGY